MGDRKKPKKKGLAAAKRLAGWELGYSSWAEIIIDAYLNPDEANARMDAKDIPPRTGVRRSW